MTILGTRPEIIRLSLIIKLLDSHCNHILVHTGQNYDHKLSNLFFEEMGIRLPSVQIDSKSSTLGGQLAKIITQVEEQLIYFRPDKVLILGDTNSGLTAIIAERMGIPVYHMEAGNRCFDLKVPEEKNRRIIDSISTYNLPYTKNSRENLLLEGLPKQRIFLCGNPINEVLSYYSKQIAESKVLSQLGLEPKMYIAVTAHRAENVDDEKRLSGIVKALEILAEKKPVVVSIHPRTKSKIEKFGINPKRIRMMEPLGFFDFVQLEMNSHCVITDSGTVQEECCIFQTPTVTIRDTTERPETVECGSNIVSGLEVEDIIRCYNLIIHRKTPWPLPEGYDDLIVSKKVVNFLLGA